MKVYWVRCEVVRIDHVRAIFYEKVLSDSIPHALLAVDHFRTNTPAPRQFNAKIESVYEVGDPMIPDADPCHPRFWLTPILQR